MAASIGSRMCLRCPSIKVSDAKNSNYAIADCTGNHTGVFYLYMHA